MAASKSLPPSGQQDDHNLAGSGLFAISADGKLQAVDSSGNPFVRCGLESRLLIQGGSHRGAGGNEMPVMSSGDSLPYLSPCPNYRYYFMRDYDRNQPLIAIHIPKSAGTSTRAVFKSWFGGGFREHYFDENKGRMPKRHDLARIQRPDRPVVVYGHFNRRRHFGVEDYYPEVTQFVTILRDPFELVMSSYFFTRKVGRTWKDRSRVPTAKLSEHILSATPNMLNHFPREVTMANYKELIEEYFIDIGTMETLHDSVHRIARKLGMPFEPKMLGHLNATERNESVPASLRDLFVEKNELEYAVYNYVVERFADSAGQA